MTYDCDDRRSGLIPISVPHNRLTVSDAEITEAAATVRSGMWASGPRVEYLERKLCETVGVAHAATVSSGLSALRLALRGCGVVPGDRVLIPAYSCVALADAVLACGAEPILVDVLPGSWNIDPDDVASKVARPRVRALIAVHTFGVPADIGALAAFGLPVIEDCAHALGKSASFGPLGSGGVAAVTSFYATKLVGAGAGGAVITSVAKIDSFVREWRDYSGKAPDGRRTNDKMTDLDAGIAACQLARLSWMLGRRAELANRYRALLDPLRQFGCSQPSDSPERVWYRYAVDLNQPLADALIDRLRSRGIGAERPVEDWRPTGTGCKVADRAYGSVVSLPLYPTLSDREQDLVVEAFHRSYEEILLQR